MVVLGWVCLLPSGGETLQQVAQRSASCPISGSIQGQLGQGSEQLDWVAHCRRIGLCDFVSPLHPKLLQSSQLPLRIINYLERSRYFLMWTKSFTVSAALVLISRRR